MTEGKGEDILGYKIKVQNLTTMREKGKIFYAIK
jgi:hypothetical protein